MSKGQHSSIDSRWLTPKDVVSISEKLMGKPDLDPASEAEANESIGAKRFIDANEDGLLSNWGNAKTIFLNPPGGRLDKIKYKDIHKNYICTSLPQAFFQKAVRHYNATPGSSLFFVGFSLEQLSTLSRDEDSRLFIQNSVIFVPPDRISFKLSKEVLDSLDPEERKRKLKDSPSHSNFLLVRSDSKEIKLDLLNLTFNTDMLVLGGVK